MARSIDAIAREIAESAHAAQRDNAGRPYTGHLSRVASYVNQDDPRKVAVAWLHDSVEDVKYTGLTLKDLAAAGMPEDVIEAVELLSRKPDQDPDDYYAAIRNNELALEVKLADLADNTDPRRLALLTERRQDKLRTKYHHAYHALGADPSDGDRRRGNPAHVQA